MLPWAAFCLKRCTSSRRDRVDVSQRLGKGVRGKPAHFKAFVIGDAGLRIAVFAWSAEEQQVHVLASVAVGVGDHIRGRLHADQAYGLDVDACFLEGFPHAGIGRFFGGFHDAVDERPLPGVGALASRMRPWASST